MILRGLTVVLVTLVMTVQTGLADDAPPPSLPDACGSFSGVTAKSMWLTTSDGVRLYAVEAGDGPVGVVLAHGGRSDLCEELPYAKTLLASGLRVLAFDFRGNGHSQNPTKNWLSLGRDLAAGVARARADGAKHVFLIGSSMGGAAIVQNSARLAVDGRVSLSGTRLWTGYGVNDAAGVRALRAPFLYLGTKKDGRAPVSEARAIFNRVGARDKHITFYPGDLHGWQLVQIAPFAGKARAQILAWIRAHS
jgi:pimeloyl-ACP methyl ester carboxylesterase